MTLSPNVTYIIKILNIGDYSVGKTSLALRYTKNRFSSSYLPTLGVDFHSKDIEFDEDITLRIVLFDTVGQEKLVSLRKSYDHIENWIKEVEEKCPDIPIVIVGNKTDLNEERVISHDKAQEEWGSKGYTILESSAKLGNGVNDIYTIIAKKVMEKMGY
ncbi:MAG: Rab family GTPase [Candidatus Heimdallarchaeaceae archaeon]